MYKSLLLLLTLCLATSVNADCVVLLHGLARSAAAMAALEQHFSAAGYKVSNVDYPSRKASIEILAPAAIAEGLEACHGEAPVHFITHSMGGILLRYYLAHNTLETLGNVVMIAPPNQGSEVVDSLAKVPGFAAFNGPAGLQLSTSKDSLPLQLPAVNFPLGVIAGDRTFNVLLSQLLPNPDDGKVSVASTRVAGMQDHIVVHYSHPFIMKRKEVLLLAERFIRTGRFSTVQMQ